jgi:hypothetical protein
MSDPTTAGETRLREQRQQLQNRDETLYEWISARLERLSGARTVAGFTCEYAEPGEADTGYPGVPRCYQSDAEEAEWCGMCRQRNRLYQGLRLLRDRERRAFRRLCRSAERFKRAHDGTARCASGGSRAAAIVGSAATTCDKVQRER